MTEPTTSQAATPSPDNAADAARGAEQDPVLAALAGLGDQVPDAGGRALDLEGPYVLWLVETGALDLFAHNPRQQGRWHFLGRLDPGTLLLGPVEGTLHTLVGRPLQGSTIRRIQLRELYPGYHPTLQAWQAQQAQQEWEQWQRRQGEQQYGQDQYGQNQYGQQQYGRQDYYAPGAGAQLPEPQLTVLEQAVAHALARSLRVLYDPTVDGLADDGLGDADGIQWLPVHPGSLLHGAEYSSECARDLMIDAGLWQRMVDQQTRLLHALDRWIERLERTHEDRAAAGVQAGRDARENADRTLLGALRGGRGTFGAPGARPGESDDAVLAAARLVGRAAGVRIEAPAGQAPVGGRLDPVERIALASRFRTRTVRLEGRWWRENAGPLLGRREANGAPVALLWRRGAYDAVDAATGRRTRVTRELAERLEPHAVMFYRPLPDRPLSAWRLLGFGVRGARADLVRLLVGGLLSVLIGAVVPIATGRILGSYVPQGNRGLIIETSIAVIAATVVGAAFSLLENTSVLRVEGRVEANLQSAVWDRLLRLPTRFFAGRSTGELASAAMGVSSMRRVLSGISSVLVQSGTVGTVNLVLLLTYSVPLALLSLAVLAVVAGSFLALGLRQLWWQRKLVALNNKLNNQAFQTLRGLPKLRVAAAEPFAYAAWAGEFARSRELQRKVGRIRNLSAVTSAVYLPLCTLAMFMMLAGPARGTLSASEFLTFNTAVTMLLTSATQMTGALVSAVAVLPMFEQIKPVLDELPEVAAGSTLPGELTGAIEARGLSFRYSEDGPLVLDDVSFSAAPGEFVAVVGASGSGKSTLLRLLIGFDKPTAGSVLFDGQDLSALDQSAVRRQCGVVLQHAQPFNGSILDCICGTEQFTLEEVWEAAELAGLAEDIRAMPMNLHTVLSDGGGTVSGGQRQRLMIAQALIRRPRILFLDEATSALDNATQRIVIDSTRKLNATRIVIAHRLSTVLDADRVVVLDRGRVVQQGPPAALLADEGSPFHTLTRRQQLT